MNQKRGGPRPEATGTAHIESLCNQDTAETRKGQALAGLADRNAPIIRAAQRALVSHLLDNGTATIDDVRDRVPLPEGTNPKVFGTIPAALVTAGVIAPAGFVKSRRPESHARPVTVWRLIDRDAALRWLAENPAIPTPSAAQATLWGVA